ncbi:S-sulfosulfanyl-L-cysteine sulfohydrolase [Gammaproteobacteria bacterium]
MSLSRRELLKLISLASIAGLGSKSVFAERLLPSDPYEIPRFGNVRLLHLTDTHAQLLPIHFREPNVNLGIGGATGKVPHLVGSAFLEHFGIAPDSVGASAFSYLRFEEAAHRYGKVGGFAHLRTLVKQLRAAVGDGNSLLLDGGDTWQGSATALWTRGQDMVDACKLLGVECMVGHWEFTYGEERVKELVENDLKGHIDFLAQNLQDQEFGDPIFKPFVIKEVGGHRVAVIGQAFPYTTIANPSYKVPHWSFGIHEEHLQTVVEEARGQGAEVVVLLSHNGMDVDLKMASRLRGLHVILGGHTHDGIPAPVLVDNPGGKTLVINSGSQGKFLSVLDLEVKGGTVADYHYRLLPVFSNLLAPDPEMTALIDQARKPWLGRLQERIAITETTLYRRGNFNGTFDQVIVDALMAIKGADAALSPGFRWGTTVLAGEEITFEQVMDQTAITYPKVTLNRLTGERIHAIMEDVCDNLFHKDPYYQQGGDMVRTGGIDYVLDPNETIGKRITEIRIGGRPLEEKKEYLVAGWASVNEQPDDLDDIWDVVARYLREKKTLRIERVNTPMLKNVRGNPGIADYLGQTL